MDWHPIQIGGAYMPMELRDRPCEPGMAGKGTYHMPCFHQILLSFHSIKECRTKVMYYFYQSCTEFYKAITWILSIIWCERERERGGVLQSFHQPNSIPKSWLSPGYDRRHFPPKPSQGCVTWGTEWLQCKLFNIVSHVHINSKW